MDIKTINANQSFGMGKPIFRLPKNSTCEVISGIAMQDAINPQNYRKSFTVYVQESSKGIALTIKEKGAALFGLLGQKTRLSFSKQALSAEIYKKAIDTMKALDTVA